MPMVTCAQCGKIFSKRMSDVNANAKAGRKTFCSRGCSHASKVKPEGVVGKDVYSPFRKFLQSAKGRNKGFDLTLHDLYSVWCAQDGKCPISGVAMTLRNHLSRGYSGPTAASLDRITSIAGYVRGNIRFVCAMANYAKNVWSDAEVFAFCSSVTQHQATKELL